MNLNSLPLGVDIGATRVRVIEARATAQGTRVRAVAVREIAPGCAGSGAIAEPSYVSALVEDALGELATKERRCVCALGEPDAVLRTVRFPKMRAAERERAARFEAQRHVEFPIEEAVVRVHPVEPSSGLWALGIARSSALATRVLSLKGAGLRLVAVDHESCALARALPGYDAVVDIGYQRTNMHVLSAETPATLQAYNGGSDVTRGIERELSIDERSAEKRKRILGTAGAGERARAALTADIRSLVRSAQAIRAIRRVALVGNGARLAGLPADLQAATGALFEVPVSETLRADLYPEDVVRSSAPDWTLAAGLAMWGQR